MATTQGKKQTKQQQEVVVSEQDVQDVQQEPEIGGKGSKNSQKSKKPENVEITYDYAPADIVRLSQDEGKTLSFDHTKLPDLDEATVRQMPYAVQQRYWMAKGTAQKIAEDREAEAKEQNDAQDAFERLEVLNKLDNRPGAQMRRRLRERRGWRQVWKREDEVALAKEAGYKVIKKAQKKKDGTLEKPGEETGDKVTFGRLSDGDPELIAMEIPEDVAQQYEREMAAKSKMKFRNQKEVLQEMVEDKNRQAKDKRYSLVAEGLEDHSDNIEYRYR